jgi:hypothetical protein
MSNPGPNIVAPRVQRAQAIVTVPTIPTSVGANTTVEQTVTVNGVEIGDFVYPCATGGTGNATAVIGARVTASNTLAIKYLNPTAGALTPGADILQVLVVRSDPTEVDFMVKGSVNFGLLAGYNP